MFIPQDIPGGHLIICDHRGIVEDAERSVKIGHGVRGIRVKDPCRIDDRRINILVIRKTAEVDLIYFALRDQTFYHIVGSAD